MPALMTDASTRRRDTVFQRVPQRSEQVIVHAARNDRPAYRPSATRRRRRPDIERAAGRARLYGETPPWRTYFGGPPNCAALTQEPSLRLPSIRQNRVKSG